MPNPILSPVSNALHISATKLYSPMRYDPFIQNSSASSRSSSGSSTTGSGITFRGLDHHYTNGTSSANISPSPSVVLPSSGTSTSATLPTVITEPSLNATYYRPSESSLSSVSSSSLLHPPHHRSVPSTTATLQLPSLAEELSITEVDFWEKRVALRDQYDQIIPRQRKFNPLLPQGTPHTLRTSRFQRTTTLPEMQNPKPLNNYAALRKNHLAKHTQCCGQFGPIHASTCIAMKTLEYPAGSTENSPYKDLIDPKHPLLSGIRLVDALQTTRQHELTNERYKHEDIEWERRYWLNNVLIEKERQFQNTQRLSTKAMYETRSKQLQRNSTTNQRPLPPATRKPIPWQYIDPLRPEYSLLGNLHDTEDTADIELTTGRGTTTMKNSITKHMQTNDDKVTYPSLYTIPTHTYNSGALFGFSKEFSNRTFRANPIESPEVQAYASVHVETEETNSVMEDPRNVTASSSSSSSSISPSFASSYRLPPVSASSSIDNLSVGTTIDPRYRWRAPARPGPEYERQQLLRQYKGVDQWSHVPIGAHHGKDAVHVVRPSILAALAVER